MNHQIVPKTKGEETTKAYSSMFAKYQGNGNDFIIFDEPCFADEEMLAKIKRQARRLCDRNRGIGGDGIIILFEESQYIRMSVINADGSVAENCGNGLRCAAAYIFKKHGILETKIRLSNKLYLCKKTAAGISVAMGECFIQKIDNFFFSDENLHAQMAQCHLGNDHLVFILKQSVECFDSLLLQIQSRIDTKCFNVGFVFGKKDGAYYSQVFERGVGWTKSCGTGASSAAAFLAYLDPSLLERKLSIVQPGGEIQITVMQKMKPPDTVFSLMQEGKAEEVFMGLCEAILS